MPGTLGDDQLVGGPGGDLLDGDSGFDSADYSGVASSEGIVINLAGAKSLSASASLNTVKGSLYIGPGSGSQEIGLDKLNRVECVIGTRNADTFVATTGFSADSGRLNEFEGGGGNDTIKGNGETRISYRRALGGVEVDLKLGLARSRAPEDAAGIGADILQGGINAIRGSDFDDLLIGSDRTVLESFIGGKGEDTIAGGGGLDRIDFLVDAADAPSVISGVVVELASGLAFDNWGGTDTISGIERVRGSALADSLCGNGLANELDGHAGDDMLEGAAGADTLIGGEGFDTATYAGAQGGVTVTAGTGSGNKGEAAGDRYASIERYELSGYADTFKGAAGDDEASGLAGGDIMSGGAGKDRLYGEDGNDTLKGEAGDDTLDGGDDGDVLDGGDGNDSLAGAAGGDILVGGKGADALDGGAGHDTASYATAAAAVLIDLGDIARNTNDAAGDSYAGIEAFTLTKLADSFFGSDTGEAISGGAGNDTLSGAGGDDTIDGGAGADKLDGEAGDGDTASYASAVAAVAIDLGNLKNNKGDAAGDTYSGIEAFRLSGKDDTFTGATGVSNNVSGAAGSDQITGGALADVLFGDGDAVSGGSDILRGLDGNDELYGDTAADWLDGGTGSDLLDGGEGNDTLIGGAGGDALRGGEDGADTASYETSFAVAGTAGVSLDFSGGGFSGLGDAQGDTFTGIERFVLSAFDDIFVADDTADRADIVEGGAGDDALHGRGGDDVLTGGAGGDVLDGGGGLDTASYAGAKAGVKLNFVTGKHSGDAAGDMLSGIEVAILSGFDDEFAADGMCWRILGGAGNDKIFGGANDDVIDGGTGADTLDGALGDDMVSYATATSAVGLGLAKNTHTGAAAGDKLLNFELFELTAYNDAFSGSATAETVMAGGGSDTIDGAAGEDTLAGGEGNDLLIGGAGMDIIDGGDGIDGASFKTALAGVGLDLDKLIGISGDAAGDIYLDVEKFELSRFADLAILGTNAVAVSGGLGADTYRLLNTSAASVRHTITDFVAGTGLGDVLDVSAFGFASLASVKAAMTQITTKDVLLTLDDSDSVVLLNTTIARLVADDFKLA